MDRRPPATAIAPDRARLNHFPKRFGLGSLIALTGGITMAKAAIKPDDLIFQLRLARSAPDLWPMLQALYGHLLLPKNNRIS